MGIIVASIVIGCLTITPIVFAIVLCKKRAELEEEKHVNSFGRLYDTKNVKRSDHRVYQWPIMFFLRRMLFCLMTVLLFDYPNMQFIVNQILTLATIMYLTYDSHLIFAKGQRNIKAGSEALFLFTCIFLQQYTDSTLSEKAKDANQILFFIAFGVLVFLNNFYLLRTIIQSCSEKKHKQKWEAWKKANLEKQMERAK